jgi:hypothetical protein
MHYIVHFSPITIHPMFFRIFQNLKMQKTPYVAPLLWPSVGVNLILGKVGSWSPLGLPNVQSSTARPKTPRLGVFLVSLERSRSVHVQNGLSLVIWTSAAQVMGKRRAGSQTDNLTLDH